MSESTHKKAHALRPEDLTEEARSLIPIIGIDAVAKLIKAMGGSAVYLPKWERVLRNLRNRAIVEEFNGSNYRQLAKKYNLTVTWVRQLVDKS